MRYTTKTTRCLELEEGNVVALCRLMNIKMQGNDTAAAEAAIERVGMGGWICGWMWRMLPDLLKHLTQYTSPPKHNRPRRPRPAMRTWWARTPSLCSCRYVRAFDGRFGLVIWTALLCLQHQ
jgi:hypothetical protein